jgi:transcriptional regulator with XRE-family HTH domain
VPQEADDPAKTFGAEVKRRLDARNMMQKDLAKNLAWAESKVSNISLGKKRPTDQDVPLLDGALGAEGALLELYKNLYKSNGGFTKEDSQQIARTLQPFLIRAEIRMSTLHRTAACLLGGAAVMLLLPLLFPSAPATLLGSILRIRTASTSAAVFLALAIGIAFALPIWGFILIVADLIGFFFTGHRFDLHSEDDPMLTDEVVFNPRLSLPGMLAPNAEMPLLAYANLTTKRQDLLGVLLPEDPEWRNRFDGRMRQIFHLDPDDELSDESRLGYAFRLAVSVPRTLLEETAKMELSLTKHILLLRIGQLRFFKTLLLVPVTVLTIIFATSMIANDHTSGSASHPALELVQLIAVFLLWGPLAAGAVGSPNRWIYRMSPGVGKVENVYDDPRMVRFENGAVLLALISGVLLVIAAACYSLPHPHHPYAVPLLVIVGAAIVLWVITKVLWWKGKFRRTPAALVRMLKVGAH